MLGSRSAREDAGVGRFCTRVAPTTGAELCWGPLGSAQRRGAEAAGTWGGPNSAGSKGWAQVGAGGALSPPGGQGEGERTAGSRTRRAPAKPPIEANP